MVFFKEIKVKFEYIFYLKYRLILKLSISATILFLILVVGYCFYIRPDIRNKKLIQSQIVDLKYALDRENKELSQFHSLKEQIKIMRDRLFPHMDDECGIDHEKRLFNLISGKLLSKKLTDRYVRVFRGDNKFPFFVFPVDVHMVLNRYILVEFLGQLISSKNSILLIGLEYGNTDLSRVVSNFNGRLTANFLVYSSKDDFFNFNAEENDRIFDYKNIKINKENPLTKYKIDKLEMCGFIRSDSDGRIFGLIRIPDKNIYKVEAGDHVGTERAIVYNIDSFKITLKKDERISVLEIKK